MLSARPAAKTVDPRAVRAIELGLAAAIAAVVGSNIWIFRPVPAPPRQPPAMPARAETAVAADNNPFRTTAPAAAEAGATPTEDLADTTLQLTLHGTWVDQKGGAAIIGAADNKQARYSKGDTITDGVTLDLVEREQVVIVRNGVREALRLIKRDPASRPRPASQPGGQSAQPPQAADMTAQGAALIAESVLAMPAPDERGKMRIELRPAGDPAAFEALGLRAGDTIVAINNQHFGADIAGGLDAIASSNGNFPITITVDRRGVVLPITINDPAAPEPQELAE
jgi:type II secretion system protein C